MNVTTLTEGDPAVDAFVTASDEGKICHLPAWSEMVARMMGHRTYYLVARKGDTVHGVLPLTHVRSMLFGNRMVSQAFSNYGGPLTDGPEALDALYRRAVELSRKNGCESIEFRNVEPLEYKLRLRSDKITMHLSLTEDPDELWRGFKAKVRNQVRKAEKSGMVAITGGLDLLDDFYRVYTARMRQLGTPCYSRNLIRGILKVLPKASRIFAVRLDDKIVGAGITTRFRDFVEISLAATLTRFNSLCPSNLLYWSILKHYCLDGAATFDFGHCTVNSGPHRFKKQWGADEVKLNYQYWIRPGCELSILSPDSPSYRKRVAMWRRVPLWLTRLLGPVISGSLP